MTRQENPVHVGAPRTRSLGLPRGSVWVLSAEVHPQLTHRKITVVIQPSLFPCWQPLEDAFVPLPKPSQDFSMYSLWVTRSGEGFRCLVCLRLRREDP